MCQTRRCVVCVRFEAASLPPPFLLLCSIAYTRDYPHSPPQQHTHTARMLEISGDQHEGLIRDLAANRPHHKPAARSQQQQQQHQRSTELTAAAAMGATPQPSMSLGRPFSPRSQQYNTQQQQQYNQQQYGQQQYGAAHRNSPFAAAYGGGEGGDSRQQQQQLQGQSGLGGRPGAAAVAAVSSGLVGGSPPSQRTQSLATYAAARLGVDLLSPRSQHHVFQQQQQQQRHLEP